MVEVVDVLVIVMVMFVQGELFWNLGVWWWDGFGVGWGRVRGKGGK